MALITLAELANMNMGIYSIEELKKLKYYKDKIDKVINKYVPGSDESLPQSYELPEEISTDIIIVSTYLASMSPMIGSLKGLMVKMEEDKKVCISSSFVNSNEGTVTSKEHEARVKAKEIISAYSQVTIASEAYKNYQYVVGNWVKTMEQRIFILGREMGRLGHT